ncbi:aldo-keto reductase family protein [Nesterenkonia haasae]|uniref:hypothetical protein n=1 Tax=Nesterenkonia haasae TaxID=2587813 RepID=UPI0013912A8C|nr:hypothetical protein [Nesterenkonia haasae]NDK31194.1 hypothetical protein [Nesterenkonia haasae]
MINIEQAEELLNAIEAYGDSERLLGQAELREFWGEDPDPRVGPANKRVTRALDEVRRMLRPYVSEPDHPGLEGRFDVDEVAPPEDPEEDEFVEVKWLFEDEEEHSAER